jgi:putative membrane-bound dehydrogenase-like protein
VVVAMTNGTSGDINNVNFFEGSPNQSPFEQIRLVASEVARSAFAAFQRVEYHDWIPLGMRETELELGVRKPTEQEVVRARELLDKAGPGPWSDRRHIYAAESLDLLDYPDTVSVKLQAIRIGDLGITAAPCEMFVETGLGLKRSSPLQPSLTIELANGYNGYLPTPEQHALGGYETWRAKSSYLAVDAEPKIRSTLIDLLQEVAKAPDPSVPELGNDQRLDISMGNALSQIEQTRGGRHWVDAPTDPPKSPEQSLQCFQIEPGWKVELVAAEPLVFDPVWITFDDAGRMFAVEYADYPTGPTNENSPCLSRIVLLEDTSGDGQMDRRTVFADQLNFAHSAMAFRGGLLVGTKNEVLYLKDTTGDDRADVREVLFRGFVSPHPQMQIGCPQWGMDNWITLTYGPGKVERLPNQLLDEGPRTAEVSTLNLPHKDFRFHPLTFEFGSTSGFGQFGNTIDAWGQRFFSTNRNPVMVAPISPDNFQRNPYVRFRYDQYDVAPSGGDSVVYPLIQMRSNYLSHAGTYTSACGTTAFLGDAPQGEFESSVLVCEPVGHLVTRYQVRASGSRLTASRARPSADFLASTDIWFRPASLANGPDGALYLADMARLWVEHPKFLPPEVAQRLDWRAGEDRGRIWRVVRTEKNLATSPTFTPPHSWQACVNLLTDRIGWRRQLAHRLLVERQNKEASSALRRLIGDDQDPFSPQHSLWILHGMDSLISQDVLMGLDSQFASVRRDAARLAELFVEQPLVLERLVRQSHDSSAMVRFQVALTLGGSTSDSATDALARIALHDQREHWTVTAVLTSASQRGAELLARLVMTSPTGEPKLQPGEESTRLIRELSECIGARGEIDEVRWLLDLVGGGIESPQWLQLVALNGLADGLKRSEGPLGRVSIHELIKSPPESLWDLVAGVRDLYDQAVQLSLDRESMLEQRVAAILLLSHLSPEQTEKTFERLFDPGQPVEIQQATLLAMQHAGGEQALRVVFRPWAALGPALRQEALAFVLRSQQGTRELLSKISSGAVEAAVLNLDQRANLLTHPDPGIRELATQTLGQGISQDRQAVVQQYWPALGLAADTAHGQLVFDKHCAVCHRFHGRGHAVGPDISDSLNRSNFALLMDILDPNQKIEPAYTAYQILTDEGFVYQGLLVAETAQSVTLRLADGKDEMIQRTSIDELKSTGKSLMPEGFEQELTEQQMADLIAFLKSSRSSADNSSTDHNSTPSLGDHKTP